MNGQHKMQKSESLLIRALLKQCSVIFRNLLLSPSHGRTFLQEYLATRLYKSLSHVSFKTKKYHVEMYCIFSSASDD